MMIVTEYAVMRRVMGQKYTPIFTTSSRVEAEVLCAGLVKTRQADESADDYVVWARMIGPWMLPADAEMCTQGVSILIDSGAFLIVGDEKLKPDEDDPNDIELEEEDGNPE